MKQISMIPLLEILKKYAVKHAVAFSGVESNAIVEAMYEYASEQTEKYKELIDISCRLICEIIDNYEADAINLPAEMYNDLKFHWKQLNKQVNL